MTQQKKIACAICISVIAFVVVALLACTGRAATTVPIERIVQMDADISSTQIQTIQLPKKEELIEENNPPLVQVSRYQTIADTVTSEEKELFALLIYHEARGSGDDAQRACAEVVLNRVLCEAHWGTTLTDTIYAPGQFDPADILLTATIRDPNALQHVREITEAVMQETEYLLPADVFYFRSFPFEDGGRFQIENFYFC